MPYTGKKMVSSKQYYRWESWVWGWGGVNYSGKSRWRSSENSNLQSPNIFCPQDIQEPCLAWRRASNYMQFCFHLENIGSNSVQITGFRSLHIFLSQQAKIILLISLAWKRTKWFVLLVIVPQPEHGHLLLNLLLYGREKVRPNFKNSAFKDQLRWNECFYR